MADNKAVGKTAGVNQEILDFLDLVAQHSGKDIKILDGKRDAATQAKRMYKFWATTVDHGKVYVAGGSLTEANRQKLDADWETAHDDAADATAKKTAEAEFMKLAAKTPSLHVVGKAVDLEEGSLSGPAKTVIVKYMKQVKEKGCFHVQYKGKLPDEATIKKDLGVK